MYMDNSDDQQDLFQEIVCQLWKSYESFRNESQFSTWMYRVAINTAIVFLKKEKRKVDKYEIASENIKEEDDDSHIKESQIDHFYKAQVFGVNNFLKEKGITKEINPNEVVFVLPSQEQLDSLQGLMDEDEYFTFIDNSTFYFNQAKEYCETIHSSIIEINSGEKVVFIAKNGQQFPFTTKDMFWDMIVFNGKTKPEQIDITNPQDEMIRVYNTEIK